MLRNTKLVLLPSRAEAFPTILLEAAACGTPFVASKLPGVQDIAEESGAGLLHDVGDAKSMGAAITRLLADRSLWAELSGNGRKWIKSLSISEVVPRWHRLYAILGVKIQEASNAAGSARPDASDRRIPVSERLSDV